MTWVAALPLRLWRSARLRWGLQLLFAAVVLLLLLRRIPFADVLDAASHFNLSLFLAALACYFLIRWTMAWQLSLALIPLQMRFSLLQLVKVNFIAIFYSLVLPGELAGGGATWYKLARPGGRAVEAGALVVYFRFVNLITLIGVGLIGAWFDTRLVTDGARLAIGLLFVATTIAGLPFASPTAGRWLEWAVRRTIPASLLRGRDRRIWETLTIFQRLPRRTLSIALGLSFLYHALEIGVFVLLAASVGIYQSVLVLSWIRALLVILSMLPISVAGLGVREASLVLILGQYGISQEQALIFSFSLLIISVIGGLIGGALELVDHLRSIYHSEDPHRIS